MKTECTVADEWVSFRGFPVLPELRVDIVPDFESPREGKNIYPKLTRSHTQIYICVWLKIEPAENLLWTQKNEGTFLLLPKGEGIER